MPRQAPPDEIHPRHTDGQVTAATELLYIPVYATPFLDEAPYGIGACTSWCDSLPG